MALLTAGEATKDGEAWVAPEGRTFTLHVGRTGASLVVSRVNRLREAGALLHASTSRGETFVLDLGDVFAGAVEGAGSSSRPAGFGRS